jgi:hypothetical protein
MVDVADIKTRIFFPQNWKFAGYAIICTSLIFLLLLFGPKEPNIAILAIGSAFALFATTLILYDLKMGFYGMIGFGFILAFFDRMTQSRLPLYSAFFLLPFLLFMVIIIRAVFSHDRFKIDRHPLLYCYFFTLAYGIFQLFNPQMGSLMGWVSYFRQNLSLAVLLLVSLYLFRDLKNVRFFFRFLVGTIFITALYGCIQQWIGLAPSDRSWMYSDPNILGLYTMPGGGIRKFSFLTDPANFGTLMAAGFLGTLTLAINTPLKRKKILLGIFGAFMLLGMSYSGTRTANIMIAAGLVLYIMLTLYHKRTRVLAVVAILAYLFILYAPIYGNATLHRFRTAFKAPSQDASYEVRLMNRDRIRPYLYAHPFGGGVSTTGTAGQKYNPDSFLAYIPPDSILVATFMETGWVGLAIHLLFLFLLLLYAVHYYYRCHNKEIKTYYAMMVVMLFSLGLVGAYAQYTLASVPQIFVYIPFIALIIRLHTFDKPDSLKPSFNSNKIQYP